MKIPLAWLRDTTVKHVSRRYPIALQTAQLSNVGNVSLSKTFWQDA